MSRILEIYNALESELKVHAEFTGYKFFRSKNSKQAGKQDKSTVPHMRLYFESDVHLVNVKKNQQQKVARYIFETTFVAASADPDDISRVEEMEKKISAVENSIYAGGQILGLQFTQQFSVNASKQDNVEVKHISIQCDIEISYIQQFLND